MAGTDSRIAATIDLEAPGKRQGFLVLPYSRDDSAWGSIPIPITVISASDGPTILLTAGIHGDEYEGPIALMKLAADLEPEQVQGRIFLIPTANHPAVRTGSRVSPIDGRNMNRVFPGRRTGTPTEQIAHFIYERLVRAADVVIDLHSGGKTLDFVPSVVMHDLPDRALHTRTLEAIRAFGAPLALVLTELDAEGMLDTAVEELGKIFISTELGGGGSTDPARLAVAERGVRNLLRHFGALADGGAIEADAPSRLMHTPDPACFTASRHAGIYEPLAELGAEVEAGQPLGRVHFFEDVGVPPVTYEAACAGVLYARHYPGLVQRGDCIAVVAVDHPDS